MYDQRAWSLGWLWFFPLFAPLLLGAGLLEQSTHGPALAPKDTYRKPLEETILGNSTDWRTSTSHEEMDWRRPKDSESSWRNKSPQTMQGPSHPGHVQVLPKYQYQAQKDFSYDYTREKQTDQIKILKYEF